MPGIEISRLKKPESRGFTKNSGVFHKIPRKSRWSENRKDEKFLYENFQINAKKAPVLLDLAQNKSDPEKIPSRSQL